MEGSLVAEARNLRLLLHQRRRQQLELQLQRQQQAAADAAVSSADATSAGCAAIQLVILGAAQEKANAVQSMPSRVVTVPAASSAHARGTAAVSVGTPPSSPLSRAAVAAATASVAAAAVAGAHAAATNVGRKITDSTSASRRTGSSPVVLQFKLAKGGGCPGGGGAYKEPADVGQQQAASISELSQEKGSGGAAAIPSAALLKAALAVAGIK